MTIIAAEPIAAEAVTATRAAGAGSKAAGSKAAASKAAKSRWAAKQAATLRARGADDAAIRAQLQGAGYDAKTAKTAAPSTTPAASPTPILENPAPDPAPPTTPDPTPDRLGAAAADRASYLNGRPGARVSGSGLLIGLVVYPVGLAFIRGGIPGMKAWFDAKFLNRVSALPDSIVANVTNPGTFTGEGVIV